MVKRQAKPVSNLGLHRMHIGAIFFNRLASFRGGELCWGAVFIGGAEKQDLIASRPMVAGKKICRQLAAHKVAEVFDPVDIGNG